MQVDIQKRQAAGRDTHDVFVPNFLKQCARRCHKLPLIVLDRLENCPLPSLLPRADDTLVYQQSKRNAGRPPQVKLLLSGSRRVIMVFRGFGTGPALDTFLRFA